MHAVGPGLVGGTEQALSGNNQKEILKGAQLVNSQTVGSWHRPCHGLGQMTTASSWQSTGATKKTASLPQTRHKGSTRGLE